MHPQRRVFSILFVGSLLASAACTLILDRSTSQCSTDAECAHFQPGAVCRSGVCVSAASASGGPGGGLDGGGQDGCVPLDPTKEHTNDEFLNACTTAQCVPFDNCATIGACDGGFLGPTFPDAAAAPASPNPDSGATQLCTDLAAQAGTSIIYVTGSSNFPPFLKTFAPVLAVDNYSVVWVTTNSCAGVDSIYNEFSGAAPPILDPKKQTLSEKAGRETDFYAKDGTTVPCLLAGSVQVDIGEGEIYAKTCQQTIGYDPTNPVAQANVGEYIGPIMAMAFGVPSASSQNAISAEAAQVVFGRGGNGPDGTGASTKLPYTDPIQFFNRASSTATNQIMSRGMQIDPTKWWGVDQKTASNMAKQLKQVPEQLKEKTIGIIGTDTADGVRGDVKELAFQAHGQTCAFWPDSTPLSEDKKNVRDGHYALWGPIHFYTKLYGGHPSDTAGAFVTRFAETKLDQALLKGIIDSHNIPKCAMSVTRDEEMGPLKPYKPPVSCACFFEMEATKETKCQPCPNGPQDCPPDRPACNYGYCEVQ